MPGVSAMLAFAGLLFILFILIPVAALFHHRQTCTRARLDMKRMCALARNTPVWLSASG
jgi:hypothetical protein